MTETRFRQAFLLLLVTANSAAFVAMIRAFLLTILLAAIFAGLSYPVYEWILGRHRGRRALAAIATLLLLLVLVMAPLLAVLGAGANEALRVTETIRPRLQQLVDQPGEFASRLRALPGYDRLEPYRSQILTKAGELVGSTSAFLFAALSATTRATAVFIFHFFVLLYTMFLFLTGGPGLLAGVLAYDRTLSQVRLEAGKQTPVRLPVVAFIDDIAATGALHSEYRHILFTAEPIDPALSIDADPQLLTSAVMNLLHNAFKRTRSQEGTSSCGCAPNVDGHSSRWKTSVAGFLRARAICFSVVGGTWTIEECGDRDPSGARVGAILQALLTREPVERRPTIRAWRLFTAAIVRLRSHARRSRLRHATLEASLTL